MYCIFSNFNPNTNSNYSDSSLSPSRQNRRRGDDRADKEEATDLDDSRDDDEEEGTDGVKHETTGHGSQDNDTAGPVVEMTSGWALIPLVGSNANAKTSTLCEMHGGTPFLPQSVNRSDIKSRKGLFHRAANMVGVELKSQLDVQLSTTASGNTHKDTYSISKSLPENICLPKIGVIAIGLFRKMYLAAQVSSTTYPTGECHDVLKHFIIILILYCV
jgi:hypothetical protein